MSQLSSSLVMTKCLSQQVFHLSMSLWVSPLIHSPSIPHLSSLPPSSLISSVFKPHLKFKALHFFSVRIKVVPVCPHFLSLSENAGSLRRGDKIHLTYDL